VPPRARLTFPPQGKTSDVAFAEHEGEAVVVKRCAHPVYLDWLRREHVVLRALAGSSLPIPRFISYAEAETNGVPVGWLVMSRVAGSPLWSAVLAALPPQRESLFRRLGALLRRVHASPVPAEVAESEPWISRQLAAARGNLAWCDGTPAVLADLERSPPEPAAETLIHGDLALDNVLVDERGRLSLIDWAGGGPGDPRYDIALALQTKPELDLSAADVGAFFAGYGGAASDEDTRDWFVRLYDFF
jgi:aminoglycoside phosphotransferase (APT) family kinase protein